MVKRKNTNIENVFQGLQLKGLISKKSKLIRSSSESNFRNQGNKIYYNPAFENLDKNNLRYILLHEEAHNQQPQNSTWVFITGITLALAGGYFLKNFLITFILLFIPFILFRKLIWKDEYKADLWAAERLNKIYHIKKPSKIIERSKYELEKNKWKRNLISKIITHISKIMALHPPYEERVKLVKEKIG